MKKQWPVSILLMFFSLISYDVKAANYVASVTTGSYSNGYVTVTGFINYNPSGVGVPKDGSSAVSICSGQSQCNYGPTIAYRYNLKSGGTTIVITGIIGQISSSFMTGYKNPNHSSFDTTNFTYLADTYRSKFGAAIPVNSRGYIGTFTAPRVLQDIGICMSASPHVNNEGARDENSCSWIKPTVSCSVQNSLLLDHGNLQTGRVNGNKKTGRLNVNCSGALSAKLLLLPESINLTAGLMSKITVNGKSTEQTLPLTAGNNTINVESTLVDSGAKPGSFQGSTTLVISFQ